MPEGVGMDQLRVNAILPGVPLQPEGDPSRRKRDSAGVQEQVSALAFFLLQPFLRFQP